MFDHNETLQEARERNVRDALFEDVGVCDWTAQLVPANQRVKARLLVREERSGARDRNDGRAHARSGRCAWRRLR